MPYFPEKKNKSVKIPKENLVDVDLGRLQSGEYKGDITLARKYLREFYDLPASFYFGIGEETTTWLNKQNIYTVGQLLQKLKGYKHLTNSEIYNKLPPQAKKEVKTLLGNDLVRMTLKGYRGPRKPITETEGHTSSKKSRRRRRRVPRRDKSFWDKILEFLGVK